MKIALKVGVCGIMIKLAWKSPAERRLFWSLFYYLTCGSSGHADTFCLHAKKHANNVCASHNFLLDMLFLVSLADNTLQVLSLIYGIFLSHYHVNVKQWYHVEVMGQRLWTGRPGGGSHYFFKGTRACAFTVIVQYQTAQCLWDNLCQGVERILRQVVKPQIEVEHSMFYSDCGTVNKLF